jgi:hypothetical protein
VRKLLALAMLALVLAGGAAFVSIEKSNQIVVCDPCG